MIRNDFDVNTVGGASVTLHQAPVQAPKAEAAKPAPAEAPKNPAPKGKK